MSNVVRELTGPTHCACAQLLVTSALAFVAVFMLRSRQKKRVAPPHGSTDGN
jgi:hypothetical protein